jgi:hypothetical protein
MMRPAPKEAKTMRKFSKKSVAVAVAVAALGVGTAYTQFVRGGGADYNTTGVDAQRTSWVRTDRFISKDNFAKGGFQLQWKLKVENQPRQLRSLVGGTTSGGGLTKPLNVIVGTNNTLTTVDNDTGVQGWVTHFNAAVPAASTMACPGGMTANASRPVALAIAPPAARGGGGALAGGRAPAGYMSVLGDPGAGLPADVVTRPGRGGFAPAAPAGAAGAPGAAGAGAPGAAAAFGGGGGGGGRGTAAPTYKTPFGGGRFGSGGGFYVVSSDGVLHTVGDGTGKELQAPVAFLPANARASNLIAVPENNDAYHSYVVYAATVNGCGGVPNRVWAVNLAMDNPQVTHVDTGASVVGDPAIATDGTLFVALGKGPAGASHSNAVLALEPKTLAIKDWFTDAKADFASTPTIIKQGDREIIAAATTDGRVYLLDTASLGGSDHRTPVFVSPAFSTTKSDFVPSALAAWQEADGTNYIAVPFAGAGPSGLNATVTSGGVLALKITGTGSTVSLAPAWVSPDMTSPLSPIVVNGVMFAASSGEYHPAAGSTATASERASKSSPAVLYALDAASGQQMWSSGKTVTSFDAGTPLWVGAGQVYLATYDNTVYAFGFAEERYSTGQ